MSIHYNKPNYQCPRCQVFFLPYKNSIECPNCGMAVKDRDTEEYLDVVDLIANSMEIHKAKYGMYFPNAWSKSNFMDHVQWIIYRVFDSMEYYAESGNEEQYIMKLLDKEENWQGNLYLSKHIKDIASEVFKIYKAKKFSEIKYILPKPPTTKQKVRKWFNKFLP